MSMSWLKQVLLLYCSGGSQYSWRFFGHAMIKKFHVKRSHLPSREKPEELEGSWAQKIGAAAATLPARESHAYKMKAY